MGQAERHGDIKILFKILDQQDQHISRFGEPHHFQHSSDKLSDLSTTSSDKIFSEFGRGVFFIKEILWHNRYHLPQEIKQEVRRRVDEQAQAIESRYVFLERARKRVIG